MFYIFAWCLKDEKSFMDAVPLDRIAQSHRRHGSTIQLKVIMLEGFEKLSLGYLQRLGSLGLELIDYGAGFREIISSFPNLVARYSQYERNCFLRWIAFQRLLAERGVKGQVWHLDGDVILLTSTDAIAADSASKTFVLQGCPVLTSISDPSWFPIYAEELRRFESDVEGYSRQAHARKAEMIRRDRELCNTSLYRNPIGSDQDLFQYLISAGILPQERTERVFDSGLYYIQNPLVAQWWDAYQPTPGARKVTLGRNGELVKGDRKIPFIHYQSDFCYYCEIYLGLERFGLQRFTPVYIAPGGVGTMRLWFRLVSKLLRTFGLKRLNRDQIMAETGKGKREGAPPRIADIINQINFRS